MANVKDGATGTVATPPIPATTGLTLTLNTGEGARFPTPPFYAIAHPNNTIPTVSTAEKILVTALSGDTLTITRGQGIYAAKSISAGWRVSNAIFQDDFNNASIVQNEVPVGVIDTVNSTFTIASPAKVTGSLKVYRNGIRLKGGGADYTEIATGFTMVNPPALNTTFLVDYIVAGAINNVGTNSLITDEIPNGTKNSSNLIFTTLRPYIGGSLELFINGGKQLRTVDFVETNPSVGTFTLLAGTAPTATDTLFTNYAYNLNPSSNADTVDGINASTTPTANTLFPLDANAKFSAALLTNPYRFLAYPATAQSVGTGWQKVNMDTIEYDPSGGFSIANKQWVAPVTGIYRFSATAGLSPFPANTLYSIAINKNNAGGNPFKIGPQTVSGGAASSAVTSMSVPIPLTAGESVQVYIYNGAASAQALITSSNYSQFAGELISAT